MSKELKAMMLAKHIKWCRFVSGARKELRILEKYIEQSKKVKQRMNKCISDYEFSCQLCKIGALNRHDGTYTTDKKEIAEQQCEVSFKKFSSKS
ncbi:hypothetical protein BpHYR1_054662 [Brachionus plicatilis]|uniref:Uncharacterized protein n=1 Tax=Brachionus plicatilis TaxID=10195 RepID=A0A3M7PYU9_BRAPC|nr:hypothetical protein BpHYR1_054662 [Brachionus plicatilis]